MKAFIHSIETCGTVDGPGIRYVIFFQGCPLRCQYCHNPDTWTPEKGKESTVEELMKDIRKYKSYMNFSGGGVTATGGEPMLQHAFIAELFKQCRQEGIHTALDTSGCCTAEQAEAVLAHTDLVLLDIKSFDPSIYTTVTGGKLPSTLRFLHLTHQLNIPVWIRYVLVPNLTDQIHIIAEMGEYLRKHKNIKRVDVLPYHNMGEYKWQELGLAYKLTNTKAPTIDLLQKVTELLRVD